MAFAFESFFKTGRRFVFDVAAMQVNGTELPGIHLDKEAQGGVGIGSCAAVGIGGNGF